MVEPVRSSDHSRPSQACFDMAAGDTFGMNDEVTERLTRLESTIAHLEYLTEQLNDVVTQQGRQIDQLKKKLQRQAQSLETIEMERIRSTNPKPPHYQ
jgi:SlyX protein